MTIAGRLKAVAVCAALYLALAALVATHVTDRLDDGAEGLFWPSRQWGPIQAHTDRLVNDVAPTHLAAVMLVVAVVVALVRRSVGPVLLALVTMAATTLAELGTKWVLPRLTVHPTAQHFGGTYPSGHVVAATAFTGVLLLAALRRTVWWQWLLIAVLGGLVGVGVLVSAIHRLTDVVGAGLLAGGALVAASVLKELSLAWWRRRGTRAAAVPTSPAHTPAPAPTRPGPARSAAPDPPSAR